MSNRKLQDWCVVIKCEIHAPEMDAYERATTETQTLSFTVRAYTINAARERAERALQALADKERR